MGENKKNKLHASTTEQLTRTETRALVLGELAAGPAALRPERPPRAAHPCALRTHGSGMSKPPPS